MRFRFLIPRTFEFFKPSSTSPSFALPPPPPHRSGEKVRIPSRISPPSLFVSRACGKHKLVHHHQQAVAQGINQRSFRFFLSSPSFFFFSLLTSTLPPPPLRGITLSSNNCERRGLAVSCRRVVK